MARTASITTPTKQVIVNSILDLPASSGGFHQLEANTQYVIGDSFTITDGIKYGSGSSIVGNGVFGVMLTYSGTGTMMSSEDNRAQISNIALDASSGKVFDVTTDVVPTGIFFIENVEVIECEDYGTFNAGSIVINNSDCLNCKTSGIVMSGTGTVLSIKEFFLSSATAGIKFLDLGSSASPTVEIQNFITVGLTGGSPAIGISGLASSGNVTTGNIATVVSCEFVGNITPLENITVNDIRWSFVGNSANVPDTRIVAGMNVPTTVTVAIASSGTPVIVNDTNTSGTNIWSLKTARKFEFSSSLGRMTYKGEKPIYVNVAATATVEKVGGGANEICGFIFKNGSVVLDSKACSSNSTPTSIPIMTGFDMVEDDFIELAVSNEDTTTDIIVQISNLEIF